MSKPKRQHFIPRSYLKSFSDKENEKYFVEVGNVRSGEVKYPVSIADICVSKNLYTLPGDNDEEKYIPEKFYAEHVDGVYPQVYKALIDPSITTISTDFRIKVLNTALSLYFRNARFLNDKNREVDELLDKIFTNQSYSQVQQQIINYAGREYQTDANDLQGLKERMKLNNRLDFITQHLQDWQNFVALKMNSQISISKIEGDVKLITSDNPVRLYNKGGDTDDIFNPSNSIQLPLDDKHILWISPNDDGWEKNKIYRQTRDKLFAITSNHSVRKYASDWIIGPNNSIKRCFEELEKYDAVNSENVKNVEFMAFRAIEMQKLLSLIKVHGFYSQIIKEHMREMMINPILSKDPQLRVFFKEVHKRTN